MHEFRRDRRRDYRHAGRRDHRPLSRETVAAGTRTGGTRLLPATRRRRGEPVGRVRERSKPAGSLSPGMTARAARRILILANGCAPVRAAARSCRCSLLYHQPATPLFVPERERPTDRVGWLASRQARTIRPCTAVDRDVSRDGGREGGYIAERRSAHLTSRGTRVARNVSFPLAFNQNATRRAGQTVARNGIVRRAGRGANRAAEKRERGKESLIQRSSGTTYPQIDERNTYRLSV